MTITELRNRLLENTARLRRARHNNDREEIARLESEQDRLLAARASVTNGTRT